MDKRAPGVLRKKNKTTKKKTKKKKKTATTTLKASSTRDTLETRHISVVRWRIRNVLVLALYALQIVQVERLSCNLCAISYDMSRFIYLRNKETQQTLWVTKNMLCNASLWYNWASYMKAISKRQIATDWATMSVTYA